MVLCTPRTTASQHCPRDHLFSPLMVETVARSTRLSVPHTAHSVGISQSTYPFVHHRTSTSPSVCLAYVSCNGIDLLYHTVVASLRHDQPTAATACSTTLRIVISAREQRMVVSATLPCSHSGDALVGSSMYRKGITRVKSISLQRNIPHATAYMRPEAFA